MTEHVTDELELYAVGALRTGEADRVALHLAICPVCREQLAEISATVSVLPDMVARREPPAGLKERILTAAAAELPMAAGARTPGRSFRPRRSWLLTGALAAAVALLLALDVSSLQQLNVAQAERQEYATIAEKVSHGGRTWYMAGLGANFRPDGQPIQSVDLTVPVDSFAQCAVTLEMSTEGRRSGPLIMQSRIAPPAQ